MLHIFLQPTGCCSDCEIAIYGAAGFTAYAVVNTPARAAASGRITAVEGPLSIEAVGGIAVGNYNSKIININGIPIAVYDTAPPKGEIIQHEDSQDIPACHADVVIHTGIGLEVFADANLYNWGANAHARIQGAYLRLEANPHCLSGEVDDLEEPIAIGIER